MWYVHKITNKFLLHVHGKLKYTRLTTEVDPGIILDRTRDYLRWVLVGC